MNSLPQHRRAIHGRTWGRAWSPADMDPITFYPRPIGAERYAGVILAVVLGIFGALMLAHWWAA